MARSDRHPRTRLDPDARRASLLEAAAVEFAALPYAEVTIAAIARRADASDALLYRYFAGKEDLYTALVQLSVERLLARQSAALAALPAGVPVRDLLHCTTSAYLDHIATHPNGWATPLRSPAPSPQRPRASASRPATTMCSGCAHCSARAPRNDTTTPCGATSASWTPPACTGSNAAAPTTIGIPSSTPPSARWKAPWETGRPDRGAAFARLRRRGSLREQLGRRRAHRRPATRAGPRTASRSAER